jgi:repressor LexA
MADPKLVKQGEKKRGQILRFIERYTNKHGYPPTRSEIGAQVNLTKTAVGFHLATLEEVGYIQLDAGVTRGIRVIEMPK